VHANAHRPSLILALVVLAAPSLQAQLTRRYAGFAVGVTRSVLTQHPEETEPRWGPAAGLLTGVIAFDYYFLEFAPSWVRLGGGDIGLDYVDLTLMLGGAFPLFDPAVVLRPFVGVTMDVEIGCAAPEGVCPYAISPTWSVPVGVSVVRTVRGGHFLGADVRYLAGLSHVFSSTYITHRAWQLRALFGFPLAGAAETRQR
jgi:hypothetical protein